MLMLVTVAVVSDCSTTYDSQHRLLITTTSMCAQLQLILCTKHAKVCCTACLTQACVELVTPYTSSIAVHAKLYHTPVAVRSPLTAVPVDSAPLAVAPLTAAGANAAAVVLLLLLLLLLLLPPLLIVRENSPRKLRATLSTLILSTPAYSTVFIP
jgi:hypothetical protein